MKTNQLSIAINIAAQVFVNKEDRGGNVDILHCIRVMQNLHSKDEELMIIAMLHDVIEDSNYTIDALRATGFSERVLNALE